MGIVAAHEYHHAGQHGRNKRRHGLSEHVAERQQIQEANGKERAAPAPVLADLAFHRNDVGKDVAMRDDDAFGSEVAPEVKMISAIWSRVMVVGSSTPSGCDSARLASGQADANSTSSPVKTARAATICSMRRTKSGDDR